MTQTDPSLDPLDKLIRRVPDFPKPGIIFLDITTLLADARGLQTAAQAIIDPFEDQHIDFVVGAESRGFIFAAMAAQTLKSGLVLVRKPGKLPHNTLAQEYELEYGTDKLEIHRDSIQPGQRILLVDDLLATGGTMKACTQMVETLGGRIVGISFLIELAFLKGREKFSPYNVHSHLIYNQLEP